MLHEANNFVVHTVIERAIQSGLTSPVAAAQLQVYASTRRYEVAYNGETVINDRKHQSRVPTGTRTIFTGLEVHVGTSV